MLEHTRARQPAGWALAEDATGDADGVEAWITFETDAGRGNGHLRLKDGKAGRC